MIERLDGDRLTALLRLVAVPVLFVGEAFVTKPEPTETGFLVVLGAFAAYACATLVLASRLPENGQVALLGVDVAFAGALSYTSGGGYSQLRLVFLFPIVTAAFRCKPGLTATVAGAATVAYVIQAIPHPVVPKGTARLRAAVSATHEQADLDWAVEVLQRGAEELGGIIERDNRKV